MKKSVLFMVLVGAALSIFGCESAEEKAAKEEKCVETYVASFGTVILDGCKEVIEKKEQDIKEMNSRPNERLKADEGYVPIGSSKKR